MQARAPRGSVPGRPWVRLACALGLALLAAGCAGSPAAGPPIAPVTSGALETATAVSLPAVPVTSGIPETATDVSPPTPSPGPATPVAAEILAALAGSIGPRVAGSEAEARAAAYIVGVLEGAGYAPAIQRFAPGGGSGIESANVVAAKPGLSARTILAGAHYDSVSAGRGADDNASGVAVLLETALRLRQVETPYTIIFVAFGAEEEGWLGSEFYAQQMSPAEIENTVLMVNLDSLAAGDRCYVYGDEGDRGAARDWLLDWAQRTGVALQTQPGENPEYPAGTSGDWSDNVPFKARGIPYVYFEATNWSLGERDGWTQVSESLGEGGEIWHTRYDTPETLERLFPGRAAEHLDLFGTALYALLTEYEE